MNPTRMTRTRIARALALLAALSAAGCIPDDPSLVAENVTTFIEDFIRQVVAAWLL